LVKDVKFFLEQNIDVNQVPEEGARSLLMEGKI
jgi:hypothetical protein